jgi:hypothetical protein
VLAVSGASIAAYVGIATGVIAVLIAARSMSIASQVSRTEQDDHAYDQANLVKAVVNQSTPVPVPPSTVLQSHLIVNIDNFGRWPIYDITVVITGENSDTLGALPPDRCVWRLRELGANCRAPTWDISLPVTQKVWSHRGPLVRTTLVFDDDLDNRWMKRPDGVLVRVKSGRRWWRPGRPRRSLTPPRVPRWWRRRS